MDVMNNARCKFMFRTLGEMVWKKKERFTGCYSTAVLFDLKGKRTMFILQQEGSFDLLIFALCCCKQLQELSVLA